MINNRDKEGLGEIVSKLAQERGLDPAKVKLLLEDATVQYNEKEASDITKTYEKFSRNDWFVNSFQMDGKSCTNGEIKKEWSSWSGYENTSHRELKGLGHGHETIVDQFGKIFDINSNYENRVNKFGDSCSYLILEKQDDGTGMLYSFGFTHTDGKDRDGKPTGRKNHHYFQVKGDYEELTAVVDSFRHDPKNLTKFVGKAFGWANEKSADCMTGVQVDLFRHMKTLKIYTEEKGVEIYQVE